MNRIFAMLAAVAGMAMSHGADAAPYYRYGTATFSGPAYTVQSHNGQYGNVTFLGAQPAGTVPVRAIPTPGIVPVRMPRR